MDGQSFQISQLLDAHGWELIEARRINHYWYVEQWLIRSIWTPTDCFVFFNFETDPESYSPDAEPVAGMIIASLRKPVSWIGETELPFEKNEPFIDQTYLYLGRNIEKRLPKFFVDLANMRQKFYNFYK